jgi:drug/metabolite transporter (DMT)-like permease
MTVVDEGLLQRIEAVRQFNRFYTFLKSRITASVTTWWGRPGSWSYERFEGETEQSPGHLSRYPTLQVSAFAMFASVVFLALVAVVKGHFFMVFAFTTSGWLAVFFIGGSSAVGYYLWLWALGHSSPTRVTVFLSLGPITSAALGSLLLAEPISALFIVGLICVILGLWLAYCREG